MCEQADWNILEQGEEEYGEGRERNFGAHGRRRRNARGNWRRSDIDIESDGWCGESGGEGSGRTWTRGCAASFALKTLPEPIAAQLAYFDKNGDGSIDVFELVEMVERFRAQDEVSDAIAGGGDDGENATEVSLKAFPGALKDVLASVYPHDASTGTIAVNPKATANHGGIGSALFHRREELEKMVHDLQTRMNRLVKIVSILLAASFIFTLGALFGLMVGADELIFKPEFKAAPDGTLFSVHSSLPARVFCSAIQ